MGTINYKTSEYITLTYNVKQMRDDIRTTPTVRAWPD